MVNFGEKKMVFVSFYRSWNEFFLAFWKKDGSFCLIVDVCGMDMKCEIKLMIDWLKRRVFFFAWNVFFSEFTCFVSMVC